MKAFFYLTTVSFAVLTSCATSRLTSVPDKTPEQISATYEKVMDIAYGGDEEQRMDIYLSKDPLASGKHGFTVVFLHGGGYYLSDKKTEEEYIQPYLKKGLNVINMNYRLKRGIPAATSDLTLALNYLWENNREFDLNLRKVVVTGFSAGAHIATNVGLSQNNPEYPHSLRTGIDVSAIVNFSGPVDGLATVERIFMDNENELFSDIGQALFPEAEGYAPKEKIAVYEPISYFDDKDPPIFIWHGGKDEQIPPTLFSDFISLLRSNEDRVLFEPEGGHSPNEIELERAYTEIFKFLDRLK